MVNNGSANHSANGHEDKAAGSDAFAGEDWLIARFGLTADASGTSFPPSKKARLPTPC